MARLEPIRKGGLRDTKGQKKTEKKKENLTKEKRGKVKGCEEESGTWEEWKGCRSLSWLSLASAGVKQLHFNVLEVVI